MQDILWVGLIFGLLAAGLGYVALCDQAEERWAHDPRSSGLRRSPALGLLPFVVAVLVRPERF